MNERENLKKILDSIDPPKQSIGLEKRLMSDWKREVDHLKPAVGLISQVVALARVHPKAIAFLVSVMVAATLFLSHQYLQSQEDLNRVDVLSELSLSTL